MTIQKVKTIKTPKLIQKINLKGIENPEEAMEKMGLCWTAEQEELSGATSGIFAPDHKMLYRSDTQQCLGVMGKDYNPTQFSTYFAQFDSLVTSLDLKYDQGIIYEEGKKVILKARFKKNMLIRVDDACKSELNWGTSFDGTMGNNGWFTILRLICTNGMTRKSKEQYFSVKHTKNSSSIINERMAILLQSKKYFNEFKECAKKLTQIMIDKQMVDTFIKSTFGEKKENKKTGKKEYSTKTKNNISKVKQLVRTGKGNGGGTAWDLFNGYTEWIDHERGSNSEKRAVTSSLMSGDGYKKKEKALSSLLAIV